MTAARGAARGLGLRCSERGDDQAGESCSTPSEGLGDGEGTEAALQARAGGRSIPFA